MRSLSRAYDAASTGSSLQKRHNGPYVHSPVPHSIRRSHGDPRYSFLSRAVKGPWWPMIARYFQVPSSNSIRNNRKTETVWRRILSSRSTRADICFVGAPATASTFIRYDCAPGAPHPNSSQHNGQKQQWEDCLLACLSPQKLKRTEDLLPYKTDAATLHPVLLRNRSKIGFVFRWPT